MTNLASDVATLPSMVARLNIELFCKKLAEETNETKRRLCFSSSMRKRQSCSLCLRRPVPWFVNRVCRFASFVSSANFLQKSSILRRATIDGSAATSEARFVMAESPRLSQTPLPFLNAANVFKFQPKSLPNMSGRNFEENGDQDQ